MGLGNHGGHGTIMGAYVKKRELDRGCLRIQVRTVSKDE